MAKTAENTHDKLKLLGVTLHDIHFDLHQEWQKTKVIYYASDKADDDGCNHFDGGLTLLIGDMQDNLQVLCDRLDRVVGDIHLLQVGVQS